MLPNMAHEVKIGVYDRGQKSRFLYTTSVEALRQEAALFIIVHLKNVIVSLEEQFIFNVQAFLVILIS